MTASFHEPHAETRDTEILLRRVVDMISNAKSMPLSSSVIISRDEVLELLQEAVTRLPEEMRQARWMMKERDEYLAKVQLEADDILNAARERAERMVQRTEIAREATRVARHTIQAAREESRRLRREAEDYCDQKLAAFEIVLDRTMRSVQAGREKLRTTPMGTGEQARIVAEPDPREEAFFDQDQLQ